VNAVGWGAFLAALLTGWALLDGAVQGGAQLARGIAGRDDPRRRTVLAAIGPYLLLGEVWLVAAAGVLLAAFGHVEAELWAAGYPLVVALLIAWVVRDAALWLRSRLSAPRWRAAWDRALEAASLALPAAFGALLGVAWIRFGGADDAIAAMPPMTATVVTVSVPVLLASLSAACARVHGGLVVAQRAPTRLSAAARRRVRAALVPAAALATLTALAALGLATLGATTALAAAGILLAMAAVALAARFELDRAAVTHPVLAWVGGAAVTAPVLATASVVGPGVVGAAAPAQVLNDLTVPVLAAALVVVVAQALAWRVLLRPLGPRTVVFF
jgi:cytochrome bd-type quinol oxidase subunit 2